MRFHELRDHIPHLSAEVFYCPGDRTKWEYSYGRKRFCAKGLVDRTDSLGALGLMMYEGLGPQGTTPEIVEISRERIIIGTHKQYASALGIGDPFRDEPVGSWFFHVLTLVEAWPGAMNAHVFLLHSMIESHSALRTEDVERQLREMLTRDIAVRQVG